MGFLISLADIFFLTGVLLLAARVTRGQTVRKRKAPAEPPRHKVVDPGFFSEPQYTRYLD